MKQSRHLNPSEETGSGCHVTSNYGRIPLNKHGSVGRRQQQQQQIMCVVCVSLTKGHSSDGYDLASTSCKYDLRKGDLFVLGWARVRRLRRVSISSELLMCGAGVRSILLLPLVARCLETIDVYIWRMLVLYVCCSNCVGVCGNICCVAAVVKYNGFV